MWILKGADEAWVVEVGRVKLRTSERVSVDYWVHTLEEDDGDGGINDNDRDHKENYKSY